MSDRKPEITPSRGEMILVINDIHNRATAARLAGHDDGSLMLEIEELAEGILVQCEDSADDVEFTVEDQHAPE